MPNRLKKMPEKLREGIFWITLYIGQWLARIIRYRCVTVPSVIVSTATTSHLAQVALSNTFYSCCCFVFVSVGLLATTLFTFQDYECDNDILRMRCPRDTVISVQWAQYGRLATSSNNDICPAVTWKPLSERRAAAAAAYLQHPSPRTDWLSPSVSMTTVAMTTSDNNSSLRRAAERITCLASKSLEVSLVVFFSD